MSKKDRENKSGNLKFESAVFFVQDVEKSKNFYVNILGQRIVMDFGRNVAFEGNFAIWEKNYALNTIFHEKAKKIKVGSNNSEIYFESDHIEEVYQELERKKIIEALIRNNGHKGQTAQELGISRRTLYYKMEELEIKK